MEWIFGLKARIKTKEDHERGRKDTEILEEKEAKTRYRRICYKVLQETDEINNNIDKYYGDTYESRYLLYALEAFNRVLQDISRVGMEIKKEMRMDIDNLLGERELVVRSVLEDPGNIKLMDEEIVSFIGSINNFTDKYDALLIEEDAIDSEVDEKEYKLLANLENAPRS